MIKRFRRIAPLITVLAMLTAAPSVSAAQHGKAAHHRSRATIRLLVTGDSLTGYLGPQLIAQLTRVGPIRGFTDTRDSTGLTTPNYVDWRAVARGQIVTYAPNAVVVLIGGNDFENMIGAKGQFYTAGTPAWTAEYQRRAEACMRIWTQGGRVHVYWLSMPPARNAAWANDDAHINIALRRAARHVPGAQYVNILGPITNHGRYTDYVTGRGGSVLIREDDGVHLNIAGSAIVADELFHLLVHQWRLR